MVRNRFALSRSFCQRLQNDLSSPSLKASKYAVALCFQIADYGSNDGCFASICASAGCKWLINYGM